MIAAAYNLVLCFLQYLILYRFFGDFFEAREQTQHLALPALLCSAALQTFAILTGKPQLELVCGLLLTLCVSCLLFCGTRGVGIFLSAVAVALGAGVKSISFLLGSALGQWNPAIDTSAHSLRFILCLISLLLYLFILQFLSLLFTRHRTTSGSGAGLLLFPPIASMVAGAVMLYLYRWVPSAAYPQPNIAVAAACLCLVASNLICVFVYSKSLVQYEIQAQYNALEYGNRTQLDYSRRMKIHMDSMRVYRHDIDNQLIVVEKMLRDGKVTAAMAHIAALRESDAQDRDILSLDLNNPAVNAILQDTANRCRERGVAFSLQARYSDLSFLDSIDACAIFANILANAVQACDRLGAQVKNKRVVVSINRHQDILLITVENSSATPNLFSLRKPGAFKSGQGLGLLSVRKAAYKYGGEVSFQYIDGIFTTMVRVNIS